ncbi:MAG: type IV secretion system DNA-binding domain-containing protein [Bacteroidetes bacterium]|nr:type IV secretion system DNA-binding domain-containing protein [Bacteroidota bacterium]
MNNQKIILVKLPQGLIGEENSYLLGALITARLQQCAMARQAQAASEREPFFIYIDEFHHFITPSMASILSGARKYGVGLVLAHQDMQQVTQIDGSIASSIMANAYTRVCFRLADIDAKRMQENFSGFIAADFQQLDVGEAIARVGAIDNDFSLDVYPFTFDHVPHLEDEIVHHSRAAFAVPTTKERPVQQTESIKPSTERIEPVVAPEPIPETATRSTTEVREHRYLQQFIKQMAQEFGYIATIEQPTRDGKGLVDVVLEKEGQKIAVEISISTGNAWEVHNVQKCLNDGFETIMVCCTTPEKVQAIRSAVQSSLSAQDAAKITCIQPHDIAALLQPIEQVAPATTTMKGYRVKVQYDQSGTKKQDIVKRIIASGGKK